MWIACPKNSVKNAITKDIETNVKQKCKIFIKNIKTFQAKLTFFSVAFCLHTIYQGIVKVIFIYLFRIVFNTLYSTIYILKLCSGLHYDVFELTRFNESRKKWPMEKMEKKII